MRVRADIRANEGAVPLRRKDALALADWPFHEYVSDEGNSFAPQPQSLYRRRMCRIRESYRSEGTGRDRKGPLLSSSRVPIGE